MSVIEEAPKRVVLEEYQSHMIPATTCEVCKYNLASEYNKRRRNQVLQDVINYLRFAENEGVAGHEANRLIREVRNLING